MKNQENIKEEPKQWVVPTEVLERIKSDLVDELKENKEKLLINDVKEGTIIELESGKETMIDLINQALAIKVNFFDNKNGGRSYIG